jgi:hypothetical protein
MIQRKHRTPRRRLMRQLRYQPTLLRQRIRRENAALTSTRLERTYAMRRAVRRRDGNPPMPGLIGKPPDSSCEMRRRCQPPMVLAAQETSCSNTIASTPASPPLRRRE